MKQRNAKKGLVLILVVLSMILVLVATVMAEEPTEAPVYWSWDVGGSAVGTSKLARTDRGISASYNSRVLTPGDAVTLWFIVFNYPELCQGTDGLGLDDECTPLDLGLDAPAQGDFFFASGQVIGGNGQGNFGGHLNAGDTSHSGLAEMMGGCENCTPGLIEPQSALVVLATHDHGPALTGPALAEQISTFLGDCDAGFLGNQFGFAEGPWDIPVDPGYCSTIQFSPHVPSSS